MDLCDSTNLAAFVAEMNPPQRRPSARRMHKDASEFSPVYAPPARKTSARRCKCGNCCLCLETARWERIFQQKFADPLYYGLRRVAHTSPLNSW
jgi:hypothetical protein